MVLSDIIATHIHENGPLAFRDFMELALYHPDSGYYTSHSNAIGQAGDYYTSPELTPAFGATIGRQLEEMWRILGEAPFSIVEFGAGTGSLCSAILEQLKSNDPLYKDLQYYIIERSPQMREKEQMHLPEKVTWLDSVADLPEISGCIISNELVDNFAVHRVVMCDELMEVFVEHQNGFTETMRPASDELKEYLKRLRVQLPRGFHTELNLEAMSWQKNISAHLAKGFVVTIDYGYPSAELYCDERNKGTLSCYHKHKINNRPYENIGAQDITSHVNFSALCLWGAMNGLEYSGYTDQGRFLQNLGFTKILQQHVQPENGVHNLKNYLMLSQTLLMDMGSKFKVLVQQKGVPDVTLSGLRYL
jgi:SAM-dependent MidA family methyltransferase